MTRAEDVGNEFRLFLLNEIDFQVRSGNRAEESSGRCVVVRRGQFARNMTPGQRRELTYDGRQACEVGGNDASTNSVTGAYPGIEVIDELRIVTQYRSKYNRWLLKTHSRFVEQLEASGGGQCVLRLGYISSSLGRVHNLSGGSQDGA